MRGTVCSQYSCVRTGAITETVSVCQATAMLWAARLCESFSLGAVDRPLGPAGTQGPICSTECVILSQQACHSSNHSNTHSFLEFFWIPGPPRTIRARLFVWVLEAGLSLWFMDTRVCTARGGIHYRLSSALSIDVDLIKNIFYLFYDNVVYRRTWYDEGYSQ